MSDKFDNFAHFDIPKNTVGKERVAPSPCGQKFSDGTPHPASLWRGLEEVPGGVCWAHCLICQSEEKLQGEHRIESDRQTEHWAEIVKKQGAELATLREGLTDKVKYLRHSTVGIGNYGNMRPLTEVERNVANACADVLASLLAPPPTARDAT